AAPRAREELVPGAEACKLAVDVDVVYLRRGCSGAVSRRRSERLLHSHRGPAEQRRALCELAAQVVLPALDLAAQLVLEARDAIGPRLDAERPGTGPVDRERARPVIVAARLERGLLPPRGAGRPIADRRAHDVVPVAEDARGDVDALARDALHGITPAVDLRLDLENLDARRWIVRLRQWHVAGSLPDAGGSSRGPRSFVRNPAASDVTAGRSTGRRGLPLRRLARRGGAVLVAGAAPRAA